MLAANGLVLTDEERRENISYFFRRTAVSQTVFRLALMSEVSVFFACLLQCLGPLLVACGSRRVWLRYDRQRRPLAAIFHQLSETVHLASLGASH